MNIPLTIKETQDRLINKDFSACELVDAYLARIKAFDGTINSYITVTDNQAYSDAKSIDALIKEDNDSIVAQYPLLGVAVGYKDIFMTKGIRTTAASNVLKNYTAQYSATSVQRMQKSGSIMLGKLNLDAWAHGSSGENSDFGITKNPWNSDYVPGGSSSGSAASVAANFSLVSTGTDTCGSVRLPANFCGTYGLKPTYGAISRYGIIAMASSLDTVGFFARTVEDIETLFNVAKGADEYDSTVKDFTYSIPKGKRKIGIPREFFADGLSKTVRESVMKSAKIFEKEGYQLIDVSLPHTKYGISVYYIIQPAEVASNLGRFDGIRYGNDRTSFGNEAKRRIMLGTYVLSSGYYDAYYLKAMKVRTIIRKEIDEVFGAVDVLIAPVATTSAFKIGEKVDNPLEMYLTDIYAATANLTGIPSLAIPSGLSDEGMPLGFQIMGPRFSESLLFEIAKDYQNATQYVPLVASL